jgi:hypothetical protein
MRASLLASAALLFGALAAPAAAQSAPAFPLVGTWTLAEADEIKADGTRIQNYGADARGRLIIDAEGRYSLQIFRPDRVRFAGGNKFAGTADEYRDAVHGMSTHYGRLEIEPGGRTLAFHIEQAAFPNWEGAVQRRGYVLTGGLLSYEVPPAADGTVARSVWRRTE